MARACVRDTPLRVLGWLSPWSYALPLPFQQTDAQPRAQLPASPLLRLPWGRGVLPQRPLASRAESCLLPRLHRGPGLCGQPGLLVCLQCNWRCWFRRLEIPSPSARSQGAHVLVRTHGAQEQGALPHLQASGLSLCSLLPAEFGGAQLWASWDTRENPFFLFNFASTSWWQKQNSISRDLECWGSFLFE